MALIQVRAAGGREHSDIQEAWDFGAGAALVSLYDGIEHLHTGWANSSREIGLSSGTAPSLIRLRADVASFSMDSVRCIGILDIGASGSTAGVVCMQALVPLGRSIFW